MSGIEMRKLAVCWTILLIGAPVFAQDADPPQHEHHELAESSAPSSHWMLMGDGVLFGFFNHQGSERGGTEFKATNWWMGMATRSAGPGQLTLTGMLSLDALTATPQGYRLIFQAGEEYQGQPIIDRQHPHDFLMQAAAIWRVPVGDSTGVTIAGGPVGEAALGPVAYMHRPSAAENPAAPLSHHTLDSTHVSMGVITGSVDHGPWTVESSIFNGREPDDNRWDLMDPGPLDSWSARVWYRPSAEWRLQASYGFLTQPEPQEPGDVRRTTASASWFRRRSSGFTAITAAFGRNDKTDASYDAFLAEATDRRGPWSMYGRFESVQVETGLLLTGEPGLDEPPSTVTAITAGIVRDFPRWWGFDWAAGGDVTGYHVPDTLRSVYGTHPVSFHLFFRVRTPEGHMGRMWNMVMSQPMR
jgi:hypothetical protein